MNYSKTVRIVDTSTGECYEAILQETGDDIPVYCFSSQETTQSQDERIDKDSDSENPLESMHLEASKESNLIHDVIKNDSPAPKKSGKVEWLKIRKAGIESVLLHADLAGKDYLILWTLFSMSSWKGSITTTHQELADKTGMARQNVCRSVQKLVASDTIKCAKSGVYVLNPALVWAGADSDRLRAVENYRAKRR